MGIKKENILIVNVNWLGDVLFSTPAIRAIRKAYPDSFIACMVVPRCKEILEGNPDVDEIIIFDEEDRHRTLFGKYRLITYLRSKRFDKVFLFHRSLTRTVITALSGIPQRIGYPTTKRAFLLTTKVEVPEFPMHRVDYFLNVPKAVGIEPAGLSYEFRIKDEDRAYIREFLKNEGLAEGERFVVINPGGNWHLKRWPTKRFAELSQRLVDIYNVKIVISGAESDIRLANEIASGMKAKPIVSCAKTTLKQLGALFEIAKLIVSNDSGPMHIAVAMRANTIALFGPTSPEITGPYGDGNYAVIHKNSNCEIPCYNIDCSANRCMELIRTEDVLEVIRSRAFL